MSIRFFSSSSIRTGEKRSKFWDQSAVVLTPAFESIASTTLGSGTYSVTFNSIPATYQHLQIRIMKIQTGNDSTLMQFNSNTAANYTTHGIWGSGASVGAIGYANTNFIYTTSYAVSANSSFPVVQIIDIHDYASTTKNKTVRFFSGNNQNSTDGGIDLGSGLWRSTSAISSINIFHDSGGTNMSAGTTIALYGIKGAA